MEMVTEDRRQVVDKELHLSAETTLANHSSWASK